MAERTQTLRSWKTVASLTVKGAGRYHAASGPWRLSWRSTACRNPRHPEGSDFASCPAPLQRLELMKNEDTTRFQFLAERTQILPRARIKASLKELPHRLGVYYQPAETLTHRRHRLRRARRQYPIGPAYVFAMDVPVGRRQDASGSASFGIQRLFQHGVIPGMGWTGRRRPCGS